MKIKLLSSLSIIIPVYNNQGSIYQIVVDSIEVGKKISGDFEILITDDASYDNSLSILKKLAEEYHEIRIIPHSENQGFGKTIKELYFNAKKDYIFSLPADGQIKAVILNDLVNKISETDMVIGYRVKRQDNFLRKIESYVYNGLLNTFFGIRLHDVNSSKLFKRNILQNITLKSDSAFIDAELCIQALQHGYKIVETQIRHYPRKQGKAGGGKFKIIYPAVLDMIRYRLCSL